MDKINKNPEIRFKGYNDDWCVKTAEFLCSISTGKNNTQDKIEGGKYPFYVRSLTIERSNNYLFDEEAVLTVGDGVGTGKVYHYVNGKYDLHQRVYRMFDFKELSGKYFYYYFSNNFHKRVTAMTAKSSVDSVRMEMISNMDIIYPRLVDEQNLITSYFQNLDNLIALHQKKYDKLVILKKAMLVKMFPKNGALVPEIRFKGFTENWKIETLSKLGDFKSNGVDKKIISTEHPVNLLNYMDVYNCRYLDANNCNELMQVTAKTTQLNDNNILKNDVFFTPSSETPEDIGRVMVIENDLPNTVYSYHLMRFRPKLNVFYTFFPNYCFASRHVRTQLVLLAQGVQRFTLSKPAFEELTVFIPSFKEQKKIGDYFKNIDNQIVLNKTQLDKLNNIKKACFSKMFVAQD